MSAPRLGPGTQVAGKYAIRSHLREDGAIATYLAVDSAQNRELVLKLFSPTLAQRPDVVKAIVEVHQKTNALPQGGVAHIVDAGSDSQTGALFSATERITMPALDAAIARSQRLTLQQGVDLAKGLGRILDAAHASRLFHHAIKPTNVFVDTGTPFQVRITDFGMGIARAVMPTQAGYAHSAPWMAPEQLAQGQNGGAPADVFSAALVIFYALTGGSYWRSVRGANIDMGQFQQEVAAPRTLASARAKELGVELPATFDAVFSKALAGNEAERFASVGLLAAAISDASAGKTVAAAPATKGAARFKSTQYAFEEQTAIAVTPPPFPSNPPPAARSAPPPAMPSYPSSPPPQQQQQQAMPSNPPPNYAAAAPAPMPIDDSPPKKSNAVLFIVLGILVVAGLSAGGYWFFVVREQGSTTAANDEKKSSDDGDKEKPAASSSADDDGDKPKKKKKKSDDDDDDKTAAAAKGDDDKPAKPDDSTGTAVADSKSAAPKTTEGAPDDGVPVTIKCNPACDTVTVDGKKVDDPSKPIAMSPGSHTIVASKNGYKPSTETFDVKKGENPTHVYTLAANQVGVVGVPPKPSASCGKFLKKCN